MVRQQQGPFAVLTSDEDDTIATMVEIERARASDPGFP